MHTEVRANYREIFSEGDGSDTEFSGGASWRRASLATGAWSDGCGGEKGRGKAGRCHLQRWIEVCRTGRNGWLVMNSAAGD
jgi:hypothetical protein